MKKVIAVVGPTGSGKTALGVKLAKEFNGVIISADSRQVYRGLDVGTNKEGEPGEWHGQPCRIIDGVPQLMVDVVDPGQPFTLQDWLLQTQSWLKPILQSGKVPIVVGGTGLYVTALLGGWEPGEGRHSKRKKPVDFESLVLMPDVSREDLNERSDKRYVRIFEALVAETKKLLDSGVDSEWLIKLGLDYCYATLFILGQRNRQLAIEESQQASRQYIRRQLTWWRHHGEIKKVANTDEAVKLTKELLA